MYFDPTVLESMKEIVLLNKKIAIPLCLELIILLRRLTISKIKNKESKLIIHCNVKEMFSSHTNLLVIL